MAYFNHAFEKAFLGTGVSASGVVVTKMNNTTVSVSTDGGYVTTDGVPTYGLNQLKTAATPSGVTNNGYFGLFNPKTNMTITPSGCCNIYIAGSAIYENDKIGPLAGGYQETNKSKEINPRYVSRFYSVAPCAPQNNVIHIGHTYWTENHSQVGCGITTTCCKEFLCGETYSLRLDVKGSPALRFLDHNAYATIDAYTGCCAPDSISPTIVDSTIVMIAWASGIVNNPIISPFIQPVVQTEAGAFLYAPGTSAAFLAANEVITWDNYVSTGHTEGECAGLILNGAYVDTRFGDCTFQVSDFYEKEPVKLYASEVDLNGDPCEFTTLCVVTECEGRQVQGIGETVLRELTLSESYRQNFLATDFRIREITQGNQIVSAIDRQSLYYRYVIIHNVPRFNNPSSTFDNDQYALTIFAKAPLTTFFNTIEGWLENCSAGCNIEQFACESDCNVGINFPVLPKYNPYNTVACN